MKYSGLDQQSRALKIIAILQQATKNMVEPAASQLAVLYKKDPFIILISCILSLRTKDTVSLPASLRLFEVAKTPHELVKLPILHIEKLIYPSGFYHRKAITLHTISAELLTRFSGKVPQTREELMSLPGVGLKTANLVLGIAFDVPALCVDTHVHRISNRLGLVHTATVEETEQALQKVLPPEYWVEYGRLLVMWGQNICVPISPLCSTCPISDLCPKVGVTRHR